MAQARMDPEQVRRFAEELKRFNTDLQQNMASLQARFAALSDTWQDQEHAKFAGEFQHMRIGRELPRRETNASRTDWAHVFRISLRPADVELHCAHEQKRFTAAERRNMLCVVASADARKGSLRIHQDAIIYSSILDPGHHLVHKLLPGRSAWLHIICGEATLRDIKGSRC